MKEGVIVEFVFVNIGVIFEIEGINSFEMVVLLFLEGFFFFFLRLFMIN